MPNITKPLCWSTMRFSLSMNYSLLHSKSTVSAKFLGQLWRLIILGCLDYYGHIVDILSEVFICSLLPGYL